MNCLTEFQRKNYSSIVLNRAVDNDAGSWWWWTNVIGKKTFLACHFDLDSLKLNTLDKLKCYYCWVRKAWFMSPKVRFTSFIFQSNHKKSLEETFE